MYYLRFYAFSIYPAAAKFKLKKRGADVIISVNQIVKGEIMKKIGLIGGLSWQSSVDYYRIINEESNKRLGGANTVESIMYSVNLPVKLNHVINDELDILVDEFIDVTKSLEKAGADVVLLCTNTMHFVFD